MIAAVEVGVALTRPPRHDASVYVVVEAATRAEAELLACQIAATHPRVVMPISSTVVRIIHPGTP